MALIILISFLFLQLVLIAFIDKRSKIEEKTFPFRNKYLKYIMISFFTTLISTVIYALYFINIDSTSDDENQATESTSKKLEYVDPYVTKNGKIVKGHIRKEYSTDPNALKNRARSKYYYQTHKGIIKERRKK